jgi:uncharacterized protein (TIGR02598 family)
MSPPHTEPVEPSPPSASRPVSGGPIPRHRGGFSLIEVALAIGITSFALLAIVGLLPVGTSTFRQAIDTAVTAQIAQRIVNDAQQTDFDTLNANLANGIPDRYFDDQGNEVLPAAGYIYQIRVTGLSVTGLPANASSNNLATLQIKVAFNPGRVADPFTNTQNTKQFSTYLARNR